MTHSYNSDWTCVLEGGQKTCTEFHLETHVEGEACEDWGEGWIFSKEFMAM
jgi:hypothetical protein